MTELSTVAGLLLVLAMALAANRTPRLVTPLRGPGKWQAISDEEAFASRQGSLPGRWLDTGSPTGISLLLLALSALAWGAVRLLPGSSHDALLLALSSASLLPVFCTGRASELPADPVTSPRGLLRYLAQRLRRDPGLTVVPSARFPSGGQRPDELRLVVMPHRTLAGLVSIEVGLEYQHGGGGPVGLPYTLLRVQDGSPSYHALARNVAWMRGREPGERVAVVRPKLPTRRMTLALVERIAEMLSQRSDDASQSAAPARPRRASAVPLGAVPPRKKPAPVHHRDTRSG